MTVNSPNHFPGCATKDRGHCRPAPAQKAEMSLRQSVSYVRGEMGIEHPDWSEEKLNEVIQHMPQAWALAEIDRLRAALGSLADAADSHVELVDQVEAARAALT